MTKKREKKREKKRKNESLLPLSPLDLPSPFLFLPPHYGRPIYSSMCDASFPRLILPSGGETRTTNNDEKEERKRVREREKKKEKERKNERKILITFARR